MASRTLADLRFEVCRWDSADRSRDAPLSPSKGPTGTVKVSLLSSPLPAWEVGRFGDRINYASSFSSLRQAQNAGSAHSRAGLIGLVESLTPDLSESQRPSDAIAQTPKAFAPHFRTLRPRPYPIQHKPVHPNWLRSTTLRSRPACACQYSGLSDSPQCRAHGQFTHFQSRTRSQRSRAVPLNGCYTVGAAVWKDTSHDDAQQMRVDRSNPRPSS